MVSIFRMREEARLLFEQAKHELDVAKHNLNGEFLDACVFYCQQAVEKFLKSYLLTKGKSPGNIHTLLKLGKMAEIPSQFNNFLKNLSSEYYISRYPDVSGEVPYTLYEKEEVEITLKETEEFVKWIKKKIEK